MKESTKKILDDAKAFVEQKKAEGWKREDFVKALGILLEQVKDMEQEKK
jgi:hypothetical protein